MTPTDLLVDGDGQVEFVSESVPSGTFWEIDPVIGNDGMTLDLNTLLSFDTARPTERFEVPTSKEGTRRIHAPTVDFHEAEISSALTTRSGMKRLIGLWKPKGTPELEKADVLQAAFIEARIVEVRQSSED